MLRALLSLTAVKTCDTCECYRCITDLLSNPNVKCALRCPHYATRKHELPSAHQPRIVRQLMGVQNFMKNVLDIKAEICQTHASAIASNNGTHRKYFKDDENYERFYEMLCDIIRITCEAAG